MLAREIHGRRFVAEDNTHGRSTAETVFEYFVEEDGTITGSYSGGRILTGQLVGRIGEADRITLLFQCVTTSYELLSGTSEGRVSLDGSGVLRLHFEWAWLFGEEGGGTSRYVEIPA